MNRNLFTSLVFRLSLIFLLLNLIPVLILSVFGSREIDRQLKDFITKSAVEEMKVAGRVLSFTKDMYQEYEILNLLKERDGFFFTIEGENTISIISENTKREKGSYDIAYLDSIRKDILSKKFPFIVDYSRSTLITYEPFGENKYLVHLIDLNFITSMLVRSILKVNMFAMLSIMITTFVLGMLIYLIIGKPIKELTNAANSISRGNFNINMNLDIMSGELKTLAEAFIFASNEINNVMGTLKTAIATEKEAREKINALNRELSLNAVRYRDIFNSAFVAIIIHDFRGKLIDVNSTMIKMYGLRSKEEALNYTISDYTDTDEYRDGISDILEYVSMGEIQEFEWKARRPLDNSSFSVHVSLRKINYGQEEEYILANIIDISEKKTAEENLIRAQKLETVGKLAGGIAHDFNNILTGIMGPISLIKNRIDKYGNIEMHLLEKYLNSMNNSTMKAAGIVKQLLSISKNNTHVFGKLDLNDILKTIREIAENSFDKSIELVFIGYPEPAIIKGDAAHIEQILLNLVINASHAMTIMREKGQEWGGILKVSIDKLFIDESYGKIHANIEEGDYYIISVKDSGIGIKESIKDDIFSPFFTTKETEEGTGLGLSMVYNLTALHKGTVDVYSEEGKGSIFTVYLPAFS